MGGTLQTPEYWSAELLAYVWKIRDGWGQVLIG